MHWVAPEKLFKIIKRMIVCILISVLTPEWSDWELQKSCMHKTIDEHTFNLAGRLIRYSIRIFLKFGLELTTRKPYPTAAFGSFVSFFERVLLAHDVHRRRYNQREYKYICISFKFADNHVPTDLNEKNNIPPSSTEGYRWGLGQAHPTFVLILSESLLTFSLAIPIARDSRHLLHI